MNRNQFDDITLGELRRRRSYKWRAFPGDVLPSFVAEMDFMLAPAVAEALVQAVELGDCGYAWPDADLAEAVSGFFGTRFGWQIDPAEVSLIPDVLTGIAEILRRALAPGEGVVINTPVYPPFFHHIGEAGCRVVEAPLQSGAGGYQLDLAALEAAFAGGARAYLLCSPHNPTGLVFTRAELEAIVRLAERYDVLVLADEIHAPLVLPGAHHTPFLSLGEAAAARGIALVSASKGWNIPGLKCAQIVTASDQMRALIGKLPHELSFRAGNLGVIASTAAYRDSGDWLDELLAVLDRNRFLLAELLSDGLPQVGYVPPQATYLAWLDCRAMDLAGEPVDIFLQRGRVALGRGPEFGATGTGHVRITLGTSRDILREIVARMRAAVMEGTPQLQETT
jgi:cysteine-S-conjugate beta-lyase